MPHPNRVWRERTPIVQLCTLSYGYHMSTVTASVARQTLPEQLSRVEAGEEIEITRHGRVVAVLVNPTALKTRRTPAAFARAKELLGQLEAARLTELPTGTMTAGRANELVKALDADRQGR